jgi:hypothetical protein
MLVNYDSVATKTDNDPEPQYMLGMVLNRTLRIKNNKSVKSMGQGCKIGSCVNGKEIKRRTKHTDSKSVKTEDVGFKSCSGGLPQWSGTSGLIH